MPSPSAQPLPSIFSYKLSYDREGQAPLRLLSRTIPRTIRHSSLTAVFPTIPESLTSSDSSYKPSPGSSQPVVPPPDVPMRPRSSMDITDKPLRPRSSMDISYSSQQRASIDSNNRPRSSMESNRLELSNSNGSSNDLDKLEIVANQAVASLLGLLCAFEQVAHPNNLKRLNFRFATFFKSPLIFSKETLTPKLMIHGTMLDGYNDGSFYIETHSSARPNEWVKRDTYPRASIAVRQPRSVLFKLIPFASVKGNGTRETSSSMLKRRVKLSPSVQTGKSIITGKR